MSIADKGRRQQRESVLQGLVSYDAWEFAAQSDRHGKNLDARNRS